VDETVWWGGKMKECRSSQLLRAPVAEACAAGEAHFQARPGHIGRTILKGLFAFSLSRP